MAKLITARFAAVCRKCRQSIPAGSRVYWTKGYGSTHLVCPDEKTPESEIPTGVKTGLDEVVWTYQEIADAYRTVVNGGSVVKRAINVNLENNWRERWKSGGSWVGCNSADMLDWISNGFNVEGLKVEPDLIPARHRRRLLTAEEGDELLLDVAWSGSDIPFIEWEKREKKPGISVDIYMDFNMDFDGHIITQYQRWCARALWAIESAGFDAEIFLIIGVRDSFIGERGKNRYLKIQVKRENEASDFQRWSAMFSPGGFRHLGFLSIIMTGDRLSKDTDDSLGSALPFGKWAVEWDDVSRKVIFGQTERYDEQFPEVAMTEQLTEILAIASGQ